MGFYRKKPVVIEARQFCTELYEEALDVVEWANGTVTHEGFRIDTLEGPLNVSSEDWVIKGIRGEFYPCKPDIFEATYEYVKD